LFLLRSRVAAIVGSSGELLDARAQSAGWVGAGSVNLEGSTGATAIDIAAGLSWYLIGGGTVNLAGLDNSILSGPGASSTKGTVLVNASDTIQGSGTIGDVFMTIENAVGATIDATGAGGLTLDATPYNTSTGTTYLQNGGTIESNSAGGLTIESAMSNPGSLIAYRRGLRCAGRGLRGR
jgi:hypothetical protein